MAQRFDGEALENSDKSRQLNLPFSESDLLDDLNEDTAHADDLAQPRPNEVEPSSAEKPKPELLKLIEEANEEIVATFAWRWMSSLRSFLIYLVVSP